MERIVIGGSRIRGNSTVISDLEVGFEGVSKSKVHDFANDYNLKFFGEKMFEKNGAIKDRFILTGNSTPTISKILSPEEFFFRSGMRNINDKGGIPFSSSGFLSIYQDGGIQLAIP